jgi:hypothetical protein
MMRFTPAWIWGWMPLMSVITAIGVFLISIACSGSRLEASWSQNLFWLGYLIIVVPVIFRLSMRKVSRPERIGLILLAGIALYCVKILYSPITFTFNDELQHWRSTSDTLTNRILFTYNSTLPVSSYFPGLETIANAFINLSSLGIFDSGIVVIGMTRILAQLGLFLLFERLSKSSYVAGIGSLIYIAQPGFLLGYSEFAYEPLAISLMILGLYYQLKRVQANESRRRLSLITIAFLCVGAVIITHHVTSYSMAILVSIWGIVSLLIGSYTEWRLGPTWFSVFIVSACIAWLALVSPIVIPYISSPIQVGFSQVVQVILGEQAPRTFFQSNSGVATPLWLQIPSYLSVIFLILLLPFGMIAVWKQRGLNSLSIAMAVMTPGYFISQVLRLAPLGLALTNRLADIVFLPLSFVLAVGAVHYIKFKFVKSTWRIPLFLWLLIVVFGSSTAVVASRPLPGPYDPNIFTRAINTEGISVGDWAANILGPDHRFGADFINMLILGSYGRQRLVTDLSDNIFIESSINASPEFGAVEKGLLIKGQVDYLVIDTRLKNKQVIGLIQPGSPVYQTNLDGLGTIDRIFDDGNIIIYHLGFVSQPQIQSFSQPTP